MARTLGLLPFAFGCLVAGCAINPATGRPGMILTTVAEEKSIGAEESRAIEQSIGLLDDPALDEYLNSIGQRLVAGLPRRDFDYRFQLIDAAEPNAFALPGGYVYASRGLLLLANSEDELAAAIAHEISHVAARHSARRLTLATPFAVATGITAFATGIVSPMLGDVVSGIGGLTSNLVLAPYSRQQEREADRLGVELVAKAGWDPRALPAILSSLERDYALRPQSSARGPRFLDSHPSTPERVAETEQQAAQLIGVRADRDSSPKEGYLRRIDGLAVGDSPAAGLFDGARFVHPELRFAVEFPEKWPTANSRQYVAAAAPNQSGVIVVQVAAKGDDPVAEARDWARRVEIPTESIEPIAIGSAPAAHAVANGRGPDGVVTFDLTWIGHAGYVFGIAGLSRPQAYAENATSFRSVARSFRPVGEAEIAMLPVTRLRLITAHAGETIADITARERSTWTSREAAVVNGMEADTQLANGALLKIARREAYREKNSR